MVNAEYRALIGGASRSREERVFDTSRRGARWRGVRENSIGIEGAPKHHSD